MHGFFQYLGRYAFMKRATRYKCYYDHEHCLEDISRKLPICNSLNHLMQRRTKIHCSEMCKELFPVYHDRRTSERNCNNVYIHSYFCIDNWLEIERNGGSVTELGPEMEVPGEEGGEEIEKPWKGSGFVATTGKLYLFISYYFTTVLFGKRWRCVTKVQVQDVTYIQSSISNLRKPVFNATCAVSVYYANCAV
ncbi:hypothetical protein T06_1346 [Trichinella sp. T6]|nr:hypothetical protein T06_1346 [Trichinella sp. T6]